MGLRFRGPFCSERGVCRLSCSFGDVVNGMARAAIPAGSEFCPRYSKPRSPNLTGLIFGRLRVLHRNDPPARHGHPLWVCECACGRVKPISGIYLRRGISQSCGCGRGQHSVTHGASRVGKTTPEYRCWTAMLSRCTNEKDDAYPAYGGAGITVCPEWRRGFVVFLRDMGPRPPGTPLDRIDGTKGYSPANCRWATREEQSTNRITTVWIEHDNKRMSIAQWARELGINPGTISYRVKRGMKTSDVLSVAKHSTQGANR